MTVFGVLFWLCLIASAGILLFNFMGGFTWLFLIQGLLTLLLAYAWDRIDKLSEDVEQLKEKLKAQA